tara:strand:+ start:5406 stop:6749 length:1344 start_codon:yes stop_codon:yes gene_type:complete
MKTTAIIIPVKFNSRRVASKNLRLINGEPLYRLIIKEITSRETNWDVFVYANNVNCLDGIDGDIKYLPRPKYLDGDAIRANELFGYATNVLPHPVHAIVHPTCPFLSFETMESCIEAVEQGGYDSAFSAESIQRYGWFEGKPLNYDPMNMVQTQELNPILMENSGIYVYTKEGYLERGTRIGIHPFIKEVSHAEAVDIDTEDDFKIARMIAEQDDKNVKLIYSRSESCKKPYPLIESIIFDFDGVLGDTIKVMEKSWLNVERELEDIKLPSFENYRKFIGQPFNDILHNIGVDKKHWDLIKSKYFEGTKREAGNICLYEGINEMLINLQGEEKRISLYTSKPMASLKSINAFKNIEDMFEIVLTADTLPNDMRGKPSGDGLKYIMSLVEIDENKSLYIGDTYSDALEAHNAECNFIRAEWAGHEDQKYLEHEAVAYSPMQVFDIITK